MTKLNSDRLVEIAKLAKDRGILELVGQWSSADMDSRRYPILAGGERQTRQAAIEAIAMVTELDINDAALLFSDQDVNLSLRTFSNLRTATSVDAGKVAEQAQTRLQKALTRIFG